MDITEVSQATQFRSGEEAVGNGRKGGIASGEARRKKRTLREIAEALGERTIKMPRPDGTTEDMTYDVAVIARQYQKAITEGDTTAAKFIQNLRGEEQQQSQQTTIYNVTADTARNMQELEKMDI